MNQLDATMINWSIRSAIDPAYTPLEETIQVSPVLQYT